MGTAEPRGRSLGEALVPSVKGMGHLKSMYDVDDDGDQDVVCSGAHGYGLAWYRIRAMVINFKSTRSWERLAKK